MGERLDHQETLVLRMLPSTVSVLAVSLTKLDKLSVSGI